MVRVSAPLWAGSTTVSPFSTTAVAVEAVRRTLSRRSASAETGEEVTLRLALVPLVPLRPKVVRTAAWEMPENLESRMDREPVSPPTSTPMGVLEMSRDLKVQLQAQFR